MANNYVLLKFATNGTVHALGDPLPLYTDWPTVEAAAVTAQQQFTDGTAIAIAMGVAITQYTSPPVQIDLLGATVPTTV